MAEQTIRKLLVRLGVKADQQRLARFDRALDQTKRNMATAAKVGVGLTLALGGIIAKTAAAADSSIKAADKLGVEVEALQELQFAAKRAGVDVGTLRMALQRMTRRVAEAAQGTGEAKAAIAELGLDAKNLSRLSPDQVLMEIAGAMEGVTTQSDRVRLAFKLFDSEGVDLVNMLQDGRRGMQDLRREARLLGNVMGETDARAAEQLVDTVTDLKEIAGGLTNTIAFALISEIDRLLRRIEDWYLENRQIIKQRTEQVFGGIAQGIERIVAAAKFLDRLVGIENVVKGIVGVGGVIGVAKVASPFVDMAAALLGVAAGGTAAGVSLLFAVGAAVQFAAMLAIWLAWAVVIQDVVSGLKGIDSVTLRVIRVVRDLRYWLSTGDSTMRRFLVTTEALGGRWAWLAKIVRSVFDMASFVARKGFDIGQFGALGQPLAMPVAPATGNRTVTIGGNTFNIRGGQTTPQDIVRQVEDVMDRRNRAAADALLGGRER